MMLCLIDCLEDGSETTVTTSSESSAKTTCHNRCSSPGTNSFYAMNIITTGKWKCKCLDMTLSPIIAEVFNTLFIYFMAFGKIVNFVVAYYVVLKCHYFSPRTAKIQ